MLLQLFINDIQIGGTDGLMHVDGRLSDSGIAAVVRKRNKQYEKNFPHLICDSFARYPKRIREGYGKIVKI